MDRKPKKETKKAEFKQGAAYEWNPEDVFQLTGLEIDKINKALSAAASSTEFQRHAIIYEGLIAFNSFFRSAVEEGAISERKEEKKLEDLSVAEDLAPIEEAVVVVD